MRNQLFTENVLYLPRQTPIVVRKRRPLCKATGYGFTWGAQNGGYLLWTKNSCRVEGQKGSPPRAPQSTRVGQATTPAPVIPLALLWQFRFAGFGE